MNNETPTTPPVESQPPIAPQGPKKPNKQKTILFAVLTVFILGVIAAAIVLLTSGDSKTGVSQQPTKFQNWLEPASEIKVGDHRYVSTCSVLTPQTVDEVFGPLNSKTVIQETYADQSYPTDISLPPRFQCSYNHVTGAGPDILLEATEYTDASDARLSRSLSFEEEETQAEIDRYKKAISATNTTDKDITGLVADFQTSLTFLKAQPPYEAEGTPPKHYVLPISDSLSGSSNDFSYGMKYQNSVYTLGHSPNTLKKSSSYADYSNEQLIAELGKISKAYKEILANVQNNQLDQSPAPTILGKANTYGSTTILDACAVLTPTVFAKISGKAQTEAVDRTSASVDITTKRMTQEDKSLVLPHNNCGRQASTPVNEIQVDNVYATLTLDYGSSPKQAEEWLAKNFTIGSDDVTLTTTADWAVSFANPVVAGDPPVVTFRVGAYIGTISMYTSPADGDNIEATQDQYVAAINELAASIKQNIANIQK